MYGHALVLVAVAEADIRNLIQTIMVEYLEAETALAQNEEETLLKARRLRPTLILLELIPPGRSRFVVLERLKWDKITRRIPVIALSAWGNDQEEAMTLGCRDFIEEPFEIDSLITKVEYHMPRRLRIAC